MRLRQAPPHRARLASRQENPAQTTDSSLGTDPRSSHPGGDLGSTVEKRFTDQRPSLHQDPLQGQDEDKSARHRDHC
jgi:hypothetical protein